MKILFWLFCILFFLSFFFLKYFSLREYFVDDKKKLNLIIFISLLEKDSEVYAG